MGVEGGGGGRTLDAGEGEEDTAASDACEASKAEGWELTTLRSSCRWRFTKLRRCASSEVRV